MVFDTAHEIGLKVHRRLGGGHIHLDVATHFNGDTLFMRNFLVDLFNHSELFMGALSHDYLNAPPIAVMGTLARDGLTRYLRDYDKGSIDFNQFEAALRALERGEMKRHPCETRLKKRARAA